MNAYLRILVQVRRTIRQHVVNQARYQMPGINDDQWHVADSMTDAQTQRYLRGKSILATQQLLALAAKIGVENLSREEVWVDAVSEYIADHASDCVRLWRFVEAKEMRTWMLNNRDTLRRWAAEG